jgi:uncharacterized protein (TIGR02118 family)
MIKLMLLVARKEGTSREEFRAYYESTHAPLASGLMAHCKRYVRNFVNEEISCQQTFDVITEFWFDVDGPWQAAQAQLFDAAVMRTLVEDEARFMDRASMRIFTVEECETPPERLQGNRS